MLIYFYCIDLYPHYEYVIHHPLLRYYILSCDVTYMIASTQFRYNRFHQIVYYTKYDNFIGYASIYYVEMIYWII